MTAYRKTNLLVPSMFLAVCAALSGVSIGQSPSPSPTPADVSAGVADGLTSTFEIGFRGVEVNGNDNKYRSDLNYRPGVRVFDSSFMISNKDGHDNFFDSLLVTTSGWGGDPSGVFRMNLERTGFYKFDSNIRRVKYFNSLANHALSQHNANTDHGFGDFDLTIFPERESFRARLGYSFNRT